MWSFWAVSSSTSSDHLLWVWENYSGICSSTFLRSGSTLCHYRELFCCMLLPHYDQNSITTWHAQTRVNYSTSHSFSGNWITYEIIFLFSDDAYPWFRNITDLRAIQKCGCHRHVAVIAIVFLKISLIGLLRYWIVNYDETLGLPSYLYCGQVNACAEALKISACLQASAFEHILMKISVWKNEKK